MANNIWDVSVSGVEAIRTLEKNMTDCVGRMEYAWGRLSDSFISMSNDLGVYEAPVAEAILMMEQVNDNCKESLEHLINRLEQYASKIEDMIANSDV